MKKDRKWLAWLTAALLITAAAIANAIDAKQITTGQVAIANGGTGVANFPASCTTKNFSCSTSANYSFTVNGDFDAGATQPNDSYSTHHFGHRTLQTSHFDGLFVGNYDPHGDGSQLGDACFMESIYDVASGQPETGLFFNMRNNAGNDVIGAGTWECDKDTGANTTTCRLFANAAAANIVLGSQGYVGINYSFGTKGTDLKKPLSVGGDLLVDAGGAELFTPSTTAGATGYGVFRYSSADGNVLELSNNAGAFAQVATVATQPGAVWSGQYTGAAGATTSYFANAGAAAATATLSTGQSVPAIPGTYSPLRLWVTSNACSSTMTCTMLKNGATTALSLTVTAGATGYFATTTQSATYVTIDNYDLRCSATGAGTSQVVLSASAGFRP